MKILILLTILIATIEFYGQDILFEDFDFDSGEYSLLGVRSESDRSSLADSIGEFYTQDISILNKFKDTWVFNEPGNMYACGYHYILFVCKNGQALNSIRINLNCNEIVSDGGYFFFNTELLRTFYGQLEKPKKETKSFENNSEGNDYIKLILSDTNLIMTPTPRWSEFEGQFGFDYPCTYEERNTEKEKNDVLLKIENEIKEHYPNEKFKLDVVGSSKNEIEIELECNLSLHKKFKIYPFGWRKWRAYNINLTTYWKLN